MLNIYASRDIARMAYKHPGRYLTIMMFPSNSVGAFIPNIGVALGGRFQFTDQATALNFAANVMKHIADITAKPMAARIW